MLLEIERERGAGERGRRKREWRKEERERKGERTREAGGRWGEGASERVGVRG